MDGLHTGSLGYIRPWATVIPGPHCRSANFPLSRANIKNEKSVIRPESEKITFLRDPSVDRRKLEAHNSRLHRDAAEPSVICVQTPDLPLSLSLTRARGCLNVPRYIITAGARALVRGCLLSTSAHRGEEDSSDAGYT